MSEEAEPKVSAAKRLYMVKGRGPSRVAHLKRESAMAEAKRLALKNPGRKFHVLESFGCAVAERPTEEGGEVIVRFVEAAAAASEGGG